MEHKIIHYLYILESLELKYRYIGITNNLKKRLQEHNMGKVISTKAYLPWKILYTEEYNNQNDAAQREWELKHNSWKRKILFENLK